MNRRTFLRHLAVASSLALATPVLSSAPTGARAAAAGGLNRVVTSPTDAVEQLAALVGAPAWCPAAHFLSRAGSTHRAGQVAAEIARDWGYADSDGSLVYRAADEATVTFLFAITDAGGYHALAPVIYAAGDEDAFTLLGGPALIGLATYARSLANSYSHLAGEAIGRALLPAGDYGYYQPSFEFDEAWTAFYPTRAGAIGMTYAPERPPHYADTERLVPGTGTLALTVFDTAQEVREARTYPITYREARAW